MLLSKFKLLMILLLKLMVSNYILTCKTDSILNISLMHTNISNQKKNQVSLLLISH